MGKTYRKEEYNERRVGEKKEQVFYILEEEPRILGGESANAVSHYHKLCSRVSHIWGNRRGQPNLSAMERPRPGGTSLMIKVSPEPGKYAELAGIRRPMHEAEIKPISISAEIRQSSRWHFRDRSDMNDSKLVRNT